MVAIFDALDELDEAELPELAEVLEPTLTDVLMVIPFKRSKVSERDNGGDVAKMRSVQRKSRQTSLASDRDRPAGAQQLFPEGFDHRLPLSSRRLTEQARDARIPRGVVAVFQPAPVGHVRR